LVKDVTLQPYDVLRIKKRAYSGGKQGRECSRAAIKSRGERRGSVGRVERKLTSTDKIKRHEVAASEDNPEFLVRLEKSGKIAAKPSALRRVK
jgi:hypothetical protein